LGEIDCLVQLRKRTVRHRIVPKNERLFTILVVLHHGCNNLQ
jgi:hypothetical protein